MFQYAGCDMMENTDCSEKNVQGEMGSSGYRHNPEFGFTMAKKDRTAMDINAYTMRGRLSCARAKNPLFLRKHDLRELVHETHFVHNGRQTATRCSSSRRRNTIMDAELLMPRRIIRSIPTHLIQPLDSHISRLPPHSTPYLLTDTKYLGFATCLLVSNPSNQSFWMSRIGRGDARQRQYHHQRELIRLSCLVRHEFFIHRQS